MIHVEHTDLLAVLAIFAVSLVLCWLSPLSLATPRVKMPPYSVRNARCRRVIDLMAIECYIVQGIPGYAFSCRLWFERAIVIDETFFAFAPEAAMEFVLAHEIGHHVLGHVRLRLLMRATGLALLPPIKRMLDRTEDAANAWAEEVTKLPRTVVWGVGIVTAPQGVGVSPRRQEWKT